MGATIAYAPRQLDPDLPWLFEVALDTGVVTAFLHSDDAGPLHARRDHSPRRHHTSLTTACDAYRLDPRLDLELRWWRDCTLTQAAAMECQRLGVPARVRDEGQGACVLQAGGTVPLRDAFSLRCWSEQLALGTPAQREAA
jgi:hypothetical protein